MRKSLFLMASLAAFAMTSCNSFEEPVEMMNGGEEILTRAGERAYPVYSEEDLRDALDIGETTITVASDFALTQNLEITEDVIINGVEGTTLTSSAPIICTANVTFNNLTIDATTPVGQGVINLEAEGINVTLEGVNITQHTAGTTDDSNYEGLAIKNVSCKNTLKLDNVTINLPGDKYVRAINMYTSEPSWVNLEIKNSRLTCGTNRSFPSVYARVLSFSNVSCDNLVIDNSTLAGAYYVVNVNGTSTVTANVTNGSVLDGRAAFNIWSSNFVANVENSTLIGHNNYAGPTEEFANIVINEGAEYGTLNLTNTVFKMDVIEKQQANSQYAVSFRASNQTLRLAGYMKIFDTVGNVVPSYFSANVGVANLTIDEKAGFELITEKITASEIYE